ncbi:MAG: aldose 1-epimerase [Planctomycetia bacterium]|nr:aldose 1-epimerase [Planctomycetia bacterium]
MAIEEVKIIDPTSGSSATILVGAGFNCYKFEAVVAGAPVDVLWTTPNFATGKERPSHSGIPVLFPYPGRLRGTTLDYAGKSYPLEGNDGRGNAIHGYCLTRPWEVVEKSASSVVGKFQASKVDPDILKKWPADFIVTVSYELSGTTLASKITVENPDDKPLPFGLGTHPYFRLPLGPQGTADDCRVTVPVRNYFELVDMLPSGKKLPATGPRGLAAGMRFADMKLDDVFTDVEFSSGEASASIADPTNRRTLSMAFDSGFTQVVVYNPPHREAVCIEPYTCVPDQFTMTEKGVIGAPQTLKPGEKFSCRYEIAVE